MTSAVSDAIEKFIDSCPAVHPFLECLVATYSDGYDEFISEYDNCTSNNNVSSELQKLEGFYCLALLNVSQVLLNCNSEIFLERSVFYIALDALKEATTDITECESRLSFLLSSNRTINDLSANILIDKIKQWSKMPWIYIIVILLIFVVLAIKN